MGVLRIPYAPFWSGVRGTAAGGIPRQTRPLSKPRVANCTKRFNGKWWALQDLESAADARLIGRSTDGALLNLLVSHEQLERPLKWDMDLEAKIQALTVDQINAAFRKHIDPNTVSIVKAGDFKAAGVYK